MRKPIIAANWKMNKTPTEAVELVNALKPLVSQYHNVDVVLCPAYVALPAVAEAVKGSGVAVAAQNMHWADSGAYTGEVSASMLKGLVDYVVIGHSERRQYFQEVDESVNKKVKAALAQGLKPIVCVGESLEQNEAGETDDFVSGQVRAAFEGISAEQAAGIVIAYEPIWAIGTGKTATSDVANRVCGLIRKTIGELYGQDVADRVRVQYGGSANEKNIAELMTQPDIDGALVGGASLKADTFSEMIRQTAEQRK